MGPYDERKNRNEQHRTHHRFVTEDRLARIGSNNFRRDPQRREQYDVHFRVTEEPEQVLEQDRATALVWQCLSTNVNVGEIKTGTEASVKNQQQSGGEKNRERQNTDYRRQEKRPDGQRQLRERHAHRAHVDYGGDVVNATQQRANNKQRHRDEPQRHPQSRTGNGLRQCAQGRINYPTTRRGTG